LTAAVTLALAANVAPAVATTGDTATNLPPVLSMELTNTGFEVPGPNPRPAGLVTFRASTADTSGHLVSLFRLREGVSLSTALQEFTDSVSADPAVKLPALRGLYRDVVFLGGLKVRPAAPVQYTVSLSPGTHYMTEMPIRFVPGRPPFILRQLEVTAPAAAARLPRINATVLMMDHHGRKRLVAPSRVDAKANVLVRNMASQPHELILNTVVPGTTNEDLRRFFGPRQPGDEPPNPLLPGGDMGGLLALSPGQSVILHLDLPPADYAMLSFLPDPQTGQNSVRDGMAKVVRLCERN